MDVVRAGEAATEAARREGELALQRQANEFELQVGGCWCGCECVEGNGCLSKGQGHEGQGTLTGRSVWCRWELAVQLQGCRCAEGGRQWERPCVGVRGVVRGATGRGKVRSWRLCGAWAMSSCRWGCQG